MRRDGPRAPRPSRLRRPALALSRLRTLVHSLDRWRARPVKVKIQVQVDGTLVAESLAGRNRRQSFSKPRKAMRHNGQVSIWDVSSEHPYVVCGANDRGGVLPELSSCGRCTDEQVGRALESRVSSGPWSPPACTAPTAGSFPGWAHAARRSGQARPKRTGARRS